MNIGKAIYSILSGDAAVSAVVSTKIYPSVIAQGIASPSIKYRVGNTVPTDTKSGVSKLDTFRIQIDCFSRDYSEADSLSVKVRSALDRYQGTVDGVVIDKIWFDDSEDLYDEDSNEHQKRIDFFARVKN